MFNWKNPTDSLSSDFYVGDRIVIVVDEVVPPSVKKSLRLVILESTETGWYSPDDIYCGYSIYDGICWAYEKDFISTIKLDGYVNNGSETDKS